MTSKPETSPFTPGQPAPLELFVGRAPQVEALLQHARDAAGGRLKVGFLTGDRGIGKTSLARFATFLAERDHALLGLHVVIGGTEDARGMVHRVFDRFANVARGGRCGNGLAPCSATGSEPSGYSACRSSSTPRRRIWTFWPAVSTKPSVR